MLVPEYTTNAPLIDLAAKFLYSWPISCGSGVTCTPRLVDHWLAMASITAWFVGSV